MPTDAPPPEVVAQAAEEAIRRFLECIGTVELSTGRFVMAVETMAPDGVRGVWVATPSDQTEWDSMGLLNFAMGRVGDDDDT